MPALSRSKNGVAPLTFASSSTATAHFSPIMIDGALVLPPTTGG
jgi:hypothetical protein